MLKHLVLGRPLVILDLETTGLDPWADRVLEVAGLRLDPARRPWPWLRRLDPGRPIPPPATAVHGITDADVAGCPCFGEGRPELDHCPHGADLAGPGLARFALPFLAAEFDRCGSPFDLDGRSVVDVQTLFHRREPRDLAAAVRLYCGRPHPNAHRAGWDVLATAAVLDAMLAY